MNRDRQGRPTGSEGISKTKRSGRRLIWPKFDQRCRRWPYRRDRYGHGGCRGAI